MVICRINFWGSHGKILKRHLNLDIEYLLILGSYCIYIYPIAHDRICIIGRFKTKQKNNCYERNNKDIK